MSPWAIYLIVKLDALQTMFCTFAVILGCLSAAFLLISGIEAAENKKPETNLWNTFGKKAVKRTIPFCVICSVLYAITPSTKEAAAIYLIPKVVNNESVQNISSNTLHLLEEYTSELLKEMKKEASDKIKKSDKPNE